jgi:hypothetical protein
MVILHREMVALADLKISHGRNHNCVYIIRCGKLVLYVGKTVNGVKDRLHLHMMQRSQIGQFLKFKKPDYKNMTVEILFVDYGLLEIEKQMILELQPVFNKTHNNRDVGRSR